MAHGKKYTAAKQQVEDRAYALDEALPLLQKIKFAKFDETVGLSIRLGRRSASTPTRWCAARWCCRTGSASRSGCW